MKLTVNTQDNRSEVNAMNTYKSRDNNVKTPQGQNAQDFTEKCLEAVTHLCKTLKIDF